MEGKKTGKHFDSHAEAKKFDALEWIGDYTDKEPPVMKPFYLLHAINT